MAGLVTVSDFTTVGLFIFAAMAAVGAIIAWFYKRGGKERASDDAIERNTAATEKLSGKLDSLQTVVVDMFHELDKRVAVLESGKK